MQEPQIISIYVIHISYIVSGTNYEVTQMSVANYNFDANSATFTDRQM